MPGGYSRSERALTSTAPAARTSRRTTGSLSHHERRFGYLAVAPVLTVLAALMLFPIGYVTYLSFTESDGVTTEFVGLANYLDLLSDRTFWRVLGNNGLFVLAVPVILIVSLVTAVLIYERVWGWRFFRVLFFLPSVISTVVIGILFRTMFSFDGAVNHALSAVGLTPVDWLGQTGTAVFVIVLALVWSSFGYAALILLAALSSIEPSIYEAARIDGAGWWRRLFQITMPLIAPVLRFVSVINVVYTFTSLFGFIFVMTSGGPGYSTTTVDYLIYLRGFASFDLGAASALALVMFLIVMVLTVLQLRMSRDQEG